LAILDTTKDGLTLQAEVNFTNPTNYSATVPYVDIMILTNGTLLGHATARNVAVVPGKNERIVVQAVWEPGVVGGEEGAKMAREFLSQYISGFNTSLTLQTHAGTFPAQPALGRAFETFNFTFPTPRLSNPKPPDDDDPPNDPSDPDDPPPSDGKPHFIQEATMHLFTSTASFVLQSPLQKSTLYITRINATAFYKEDDVGKILYELPFAVPPGLSETPRLPVEWSLGSVGYEAVRKALGGELRLSAKADVGIKIGDYAVQVWFVGGGIGAKVRL
jgi:hypothetical protein